MSQTKAQLIDPVDLSIVTADLADDAVTAAKLASNAVVNASVDASAAIAGSKISPSFTSNITITNSAPKISFTDTNADSDFEIKGNAGKLEFIDTTNSRDVLLLNSDGHVDVTGNLDVGAGIDVTGAITGTGDLTIDTNTLHVDSSNNRVGIGTTSPVTDIHTVSSSDHIITHQSSTVGADIRMNFRDSGNTDQGGIHYLFNGNSLKFLTATSERMRIDTSGRLMLGTTSVTAVPIATTNRNPQAEIVGSLSGSNHHGSLSIRCTNDSANLYLGSALTSGNRTAGSVVFLLNDGTDYHAGARIDCANDDTTANNDTPGRLVFLTTADGASSPSERMRIDASGNVGIGTTSPSRKLHVASSFIRVDDGFGLDSSGSTERVTLDNGFISLRTGSADRMRIDSSGRLLIGNTTGGSMNAAADNLVVGSGTGHNGMTIFSAADADGWVVFNDAANNTLTGAINYNHVNNNFAFYTNAAERMRIDSSGRVLIGTTTAAALLTLDNTGQTTQSLIQCEDVGGSGAHAHIVLKNTTGTVATINTVSDNLEFRVDDATTFSNISGTERMRIDSSGRLLLGTTSARGLGKLEIEGTSFENSGLTLVRNVNSTGATSLNICKSRGGIGSVTSVANNDVLGGINFRGADGANLRDACDIRGEVDGTPSQGTDMPGRLVFRTSADGSSSPTERMRIDSSGRVGIGTTNIGAYNGNFDNFVIRGSGNTGMTISTDDNSFGQISFSNAEDTHVSGAIQYRNSDNILELRAGESNGAVIFSTVSNTERMRITSSGLVGIGTTSPQQELHVVGDSDACVRLTCTDGGAASFQLGDASDTVIGGITLDSSDNSIQIRGNNNTERMRIDADGHFHYGKTSASFATEGFSFRNLGSGAFLMQGTRDGSGGAVIELNRQTNVGRQIEFYRGSSNLVGHIESNNTSTAYNTSGSDRTLKKNFESWNENVLNLFKGINPQKFNFIQEDDGAEKSKGFVAQDMVNNFPEAYTKGEEKDAKYFFNPSGMVIYLMKAIQELEAEVAALKAG